MERQTSKDTVEDTRDISGTVVVESNRSEKNIRVVG